MDGSGILELFLKTSGRIKMHYLYAYLACSRMTLALGRNVGEPGSLPCFAWGAEYTSPEISLTAPTEQGALSPWLTPSTLYALFKWLL